MDSETWGMVSPISFFTTSTEAPAGLKDVGEYQDGTSYKYTAGEFKTIDEAMKYRKVMQDKGMKDCFVVKFKDGVRLKN